ncbi:MAG: branched-chain amino acid transaminase [Catalinimonas sp.]
MEYYQPHTIVYHGGRFLPADQARGSLFSQTLHYGLGVFGGLRAYDTPDGPRIFRARAHFERLLASARIMGIPCDYSADRLMQIAYQLLDENQLEAAYLRPLLYLDDNMSLQLKETSASTLLMAAWPWDKLLGDRPLHVHVSSIVRPSPKAFPTEAKTCGLYVNSILASTHARRQGYDEALLLDPDGNVAEGASANVFYERDGVLYTPPRGHILPGITRRAVIDLAREKEIEVVERHFKTDELYAADAAFFTGTAVEIAPIASVNRISYRKPYEETLTYELEQDFKIYVRSFPDPSYTII